MKEIVLKKEPTRKEDGSSFFSKCLDQALVYLGIREHNRFELSVKLKSKGYEKDIISKVLDSLEEDGSLSEERYVRSFVRSSNRRHPEGKSLILRRLAAKGADRNVAEQVVREIYTDSYTAELAEQARAQIVKKGRAKTEDEIRFEMAKLGFRVVQY
ncbi:MAG: regulatory protein RecX [Spirochaetales bacterium]|nr:regulatory protein RecX [Spirochaetales bacterium]